MKRFLLFAMAAIAMLSFTACDDSTDPEIEGTWIMRAHAYHYFDATFNSNGTYEWKWMGVSGTRIDAGDYTFVNSVVTMNPNTFKETDYAIGKLLTISRDEFGWPGGARTVKVTPITKGAALWEWENDYMMQSTEDPILVLREDFTQSISQTQMQGTWERHNSEGKLEARVIVAGNKYTYYEVDELQGHMIVCKTIGTWSHKNATLTLTPSEILFSYKYEGGVYSFNDVNPESLECENWIKASYTQDPMEMYVCIYDGNIYTVVEGIYKKTK